MKTEIKKCPLCGSEKYFIVYQFDNFSILACRNCGLRRRNLRLTKTDREKLYSKKYFTAEQKEYFAPCLKDIANDDFRIRDFSSRLIELEGLVDGKKKRMLDIGCATGTFMKLAEQRGWKTQGIDISTFAINIAKNQGLQARVASVEDFSLPKYKFDVITAWEVVPNFERINLGFAKIKRMLKPNGVLVVQLTVTDSLLFDLSNLIYRLSLGRVALFVKNGYPINHTCHFSRRTLKKFMRKHGFKIVKSENIEFNFRYSKIPKVLLPALGLIGFIAKTVGKTTQYRLFAKRV